MRRWVRPASLEIQARRLGGPPRAGLEADVEGHEGPAGLGDLEKAFPSILLDGLLEVLQYLGAPQAFCTFVRNLYVNVCRYARGRQGTYNWGTSRRGLKTGCGIYKNRESGMLRMT